MTGNSKDVSASMDMAGWFTDAFLLNGKPLSHITHTIWNAYSDVGYHGHECYYQMQSPFYMQNCKASSLGLSQFIILACSSCNPSFSLSPSLSFEGDSFCSKIFSLWSAIGIWWLNQCNWLSPIDFCLNLRTSSVSSCCFSILHLRIIIFTWHNEANGSFKDF